MDPSKEVTSQVRPCEIATNQSSNDTHWYKRKRLGWRFGILTGTILAFLTLIINTALSGATAARKETVRYSSNGKALYEGDCDKVRGLNIGIHLIINLLSTVLLSASNYGMQCLSAPTRAEVDKAHSKGVWLNIGVLSVRNLGRISGKRVFLWFILGLSSLPLHLFYNSAVYSSIHAREYVIFSATEEMVRPNSSIIWLGLNNQSEFGYATAQRLHTKALNNQLTRLENQDCINAYATAFQTRRGSVILVSNDTNVPEPTAERMLLSIFVPGHGDHCAAHPFQWICGGTMWDCEFGTMCDTKWMSIDAANWRPLGPKVLYCLSENVDQLCRLQFNRQLAFVVITFNLVKALVLAYIFFAVKEKPLLTIGDAVVSFLKRPDDTTSGLCLMSKKKLDEWTNSRIVSERLGRPYDPTRKRWSTGISKARWATCIVLYALVLMLCLALFLYSIIGRAAPTDQLLSLPLGAADPRAFIYSFIKNTLLFNVFIANLPQLILSGTYFTYNGLFTCFLLGSEWASYSIERKGLRVSDGPEGAQRSTYFLQLPYRFAFPLIIMSGVLHWLCSQSIFLVSVFLDSSSIFEGVLFPDDLPEHVPREFLDDSSKLFIPVELTDDLSKLFVPTEFALCGYSPRAILAVVIIGVVMVCIAFAVGMLRFQTGMPIAGSCSAAISALCHVPGSEDGEEAARMPVQWGVTSADSDTNEVFMHCSFSGREVQEPQSGVIYAGLRALQDTSTPRVRKQVI